MHQDFDKSLVVHFEPAEVQDVQEEGSLGPSTHLDDREVSLPDTFGDDLIEGAVGTHDLLHVARIAVVSGPASVYDTDILARDTQDLRCAHHDLSQLRNLALNRVDSICERSLIGPGGRSSAL